MTQAAQAYGKTATKTATPRDMEADLLLQAASQLQSIRDGWASKHTELNAALTNNRKLWSLLVATVTRPDNPLPANIRQNVANIGIYVFKQTLTTMANPKPESLGALININRELASGLRGRA
jgi:flagellar biosynthesis activator protein FlaF